MGDRRPKRVAGHRNPHDAETEKDLCIANLHLSAYDQTWYCRPRNDQSEEWTIAVQGHPETGSSKGSGS